jgi:hypothetical protein
MKNLHFFAMIFESNLHHKWVFFFQKIAPVSEDYKNCVRAVSMIVCIVVWRRRSHRTWNICQVTGSGAQLTFPYCSRLIQNAKQQNFLCLCFFFVRLIGARASFSRAAPHPKVKETLSAFQANNYPSIEHFSGKIRVGVGARSLRGTKKTN